MAFPRTKNTHSLIQDITGTQIHYHPLNIAETNIPNLKQLSQKHQALLPLIKQLILPRLKFDLAKFPHFFKTFLLLSTLKPDAAMIILPWPDYGMGSILANGFLSIPTLVVFQLSPHPVAIGKIKRELYRWARQRHQQWVSVSKSSCRWVCQSFGMPQKEVSCIYNGATFAAGPARDITAARRQVRRELGLPERTIIALTVAHLNEQKGHDFLIPAIPHLKEEFPDLRFVWVGEGEKKDDLLQLLEEYGAGDQVFMLGYRPDIPRLLQASDLFIFPTYYEGQPFALLEAMAYALPVIATNTDGIPEVLQHRVHGLLTRKGDSCDLLETIRWALRHEDEMQVMAGNARRRTKDFSRENMLAQTLTSLERLVVTRR